MEEELERPVEYTVKRTIYFGDGRETRAEWKIWGLPGPPALEGRIAIYGDKEIELSAVFPEAERLRKGRSAGRKLDLLVAGVIDKNVYEYLVAGGKVLHIPSGKKGSWKVDSIWFLRGAPWAPRKPRAFYHRIPGRMLAFLHSFELQGKGVIRGEGIWREVDPLLFFLETHDLEKVRPNLLLFMANAGKGVLLVSALNHSGGKKKNYAGYWLARELASYLLLGPRPQAGLSVKTLNALKDSIEGEYFTIRGTWLFRKDERDVGEKEAWFKPGTEEKGWMELTPGSSREGGIWNAYDGWGWYRKKVFIPGSWKGKNIKIVFDSVDDMYLLFVNGKKAGGHGKMDKSETSYLKRTWVDVSRFVNPGRDNLICVKVYDWYGAGGLNGRVWMTTGPAEEKLDFLSK